MKTISLKKSKPFKGVTFFVDRQTKNLDNLEFDYYYFKDSAVDFDKHKTYIHNKPIKTVFYRYDKLDKNIKGMTMTDKSAKMGSCGLDVNFFGENFNSSNFTLSPSKFVSDDLDNRMFACPLGQSLNGIQIKLDRDNNFKGDTLKFSCTKDYISSEKYIMGFILIKLLLILFIIFYFLLKH